MTFLAVVFVSNLYSILYSEHIWNQSISSKLFWRKLILFGNFRTVVSVLSIWLWTVHYSHLLSLNIHKAKLMHYERAFAKPNSRAELANLLPWIIEILFCINALTPKADLYSEGWVVFLTKLPQNVSCHNIITRHKMYFCRLVLKRAFFCF